MVKDPSQNLSLPPKNGHAVKIGEASRILGLHKDTLRRWEKTGKITTIRTPGGTRLYSLDELSSLNPSAEQLPGKKEEHIDNTTIESKTSQIEKRDLTRALKPRSSMPDFLAISAAMFLLLITLGIGNIKLSEVKNYQPLSTPIQSAPSPAVLAATSSALEVVILDELAFAATSSATPMAIDEANFKPTVKVVLSDNSSVVNIRQEPTTNSEKIGKAKDGDTFEFVSLDSDWYEIKLDDGQIGFISAKYVVMEEINN